MLILVRGDCDPCVIASGSEAIQFFPVTAGLDCYVANAPRNDGEGSLRRNLEASEVIADVFVEERALRICGAEIRVYLLRHTGIDIAAAGDEGDGQLLYRRFVMMLADDR